ncbi:type I pullulanase [Salipaludibacillus sp. HK11]|uniref:type I pullulanase n=1 Tax=Salipaludibacillus sp. HK11 TaxID=3394320 RepID=UPI0039FC4ECD
MERYLAWMDDIHYVELQGEQINDMNDRQEGARIVAKDNPSNHWSLTIKQVNSPERILFYSIDPLPIGLELTLKYRDIEAPVYSRKVVRTSWFESEFNATDIEFGALYQRSATIFRTWTPVATSMNVKLDSETIPMTRKEKGIWECEVKKDCHKLPYVYEGMINGEVVEVVDPYAKALTVNSKAAVVIDLAQTDPDNFRNTPIPSINHLQDSSIYELHVRDATIHSDSGVDIKGKYLGLAEKGSETNRSYSTALNYIKDLGVTHVQLLPVNDFARIDDLRPNDQYNWGYDPLFFQVPEGSYSVDPTDSSSRINELKTLVQAFHEEQLSIILDVVYNHVFIMEESSFEKLVPGYYFRYHPDDTVSNGTGVGNDFASERVMARKFILDSIDFWLNEYLVDGFRFDLMGELDIQTMKEIQIRCDSANRQIMLLGEGWDLPTALHSEQRATSHQSHQIPGIRFFNDFFRDTVKGNLFDSFDYGYINGKGKNIERLPQLIKGSSSEKEQIAPFVSNVTQTVNYVECHDNHTLWDRLLVSNGEESNNDLKEMHKLATGLTLVSQGIPFLHAGQEWFRSKNGEGNSYISSDEVNQLDWMEREKQEEHIEFVRKLLKIRNENPVFRLQSKNEIDRRVHVLETPAPIFGFTLLGIEKDFCIYVNPTKKRYQIILPSTGNWEVLVSNLVKMAHINSLIKGQYTELEPYEFLVIKKSRL